MFSFILPFSTLQEFNSYIWTSMMFETILQFFEIRTLLSLRNEIYFSYVSRDLVAEAARRLVPSMVVNAGTARQFLQSVPPMRTTTSYRATLNERKPGIFLVPLKIEVDVQSSRRHVLDKNCDISNSVSGSTPADEHISTSAADRERATASPGFH
jgi:hypothetical protein